MKCGSETSHLAEQVRKAELQIFAIQDRAEAREQNFTYLAVKAVQERKRNFIFLAVNAERKCGRGTSDLWQSRQSGNAEAEHQVFGSQGRAEVWGWTGWSPTPASLPLYPHFPPPRLPPPFPHFPPLRIFLPPPSKKNKQQKQEVISSYNLSFQCMDYYQSFKTV